MSQCDTVTCHVAHIRCQVSVVRCNESYLKKKMIFGGVDKVVELVGGGFVINGAYTVLSRSYPDL